MKTILASQSPYRAQQLTESGISFESMNPKVNEDEFKEKITDPLHLAETLAFEKAKAVIRRISYEEGQDYSIVGGDQLLSFQGQIMGKAGSPEAAVEQLMTLKGQTHSLVSSVCIIFTSDLETFDIQRKNVISKIVIKDLDAEAFKAYVDKDETWDCAGSYKIEKNGREIIESINTEDESAIMGLPMNWLKVTLASHTPSNN